MNRWTNMLATAYAVAWQSTFVYLTFFDGYAYTWWNWPIALGANQILGAVWPIYWAVLRPLMQG